MATTGKTVTQSGLRLPLTIELVFEWVYRIEERLGMMAEDRKPKDSQIDAAEAEANDWLAGELRYKEIESEFDF
jgi:hypothetical protein